MIADATLLNQALSRALDLRDWPLRSRPAEALASLSRATKAEVLDELTAAIERATKAVEEVYYSTTGDSDDAAHAAVAAILPWIDPQNLRRFVGRAIATLQRG
ncbi:MAG TPA: hypothetical protein VFF06_27385 [Polyangia bacterium]|nr:hypothetical protein [Polyangia bacterium]